MRGTGLASKPVNYYIYDNRDQALHNEFLSRITYEFDEDFKDCEFPKPDRICRIAEVRQTDINSVEARRKFCEVANGNSFTYFIISLNADLEDAAYAQTLKRMLPDNAAYRIFVRNKSNAERLCDDGIIYFGEEGADIHSRVHSERRFVRTCATHKYAVRQHRKPSRMVAVK